MEIFTRKVRIITMYDNFKIMSNETSDAPVIIKFVGETVCDKKYEVERRCSDLSALEYIVDGCGTLEINGQVLHPKKGDIFLLTQGSNHRYYTNTENCWHKYFISFCGDFSLQMIKEYLPKDTYLFEGCFMEKRFSHIFDIAFNSTDNKKAQTELSVELFKLINYLREHEINENEDFADKIKNTIENHLDEAFDLDVLCSYMNYSKNHLINIFTKKYGITPYQYYINCKIGIAKEYLTNTTMSIAEISSALLYSDQQYFSYCFKKATGYSPRSYRNNTKL